MKHGNLSDDKSSLQASVLVFFILSTISGILSNPQKSFHSFSQLANRLMKNEVGLNCMISL